MSRRLRAADLFCGAGGTSTGLSRACSAAGLDLDLVAVNHWDVAVETHSANHPKAKHLCASLDSLDPRRAVGKGKLDLLLASPECTHHSIARGGKPVNDQSRASAWHVVHWAETLRPRAILVENVREFRTWGPIGSNGRPLKSRKGETFEAWCAALRSLGYRVEARLLCAADYGDPTTRERLFVAAVRGRTPIKWPAPTHAKDGEADLFGERIPWKTAREIINWDDHGDSIFTRKKPLADATLRRIAEGLKRFGGDSAEPFLAILRGTGTVRDLDRPVPALTAGGEHLALVEPFLVPFYGERKGQAPRTHSVRDPLPTSPASASKFGLVNPFLLGLTHGGRLRDVERPLPTVTTANRGEVALINPFLVRYQGTGGAEDIGRPVSTVTTRDRLGLVGPTDKYDILFRMLRPRELARAQGFPDDYDFRGNRTQIVRQIGNAVCIGLSTALCSAMIRRAS